MVEDSPFMNLESHFVKTVKAFDDWYWMVLQDGYESCYSWTSGVNMFSVLGKSYVSRTRAFHTRIYTLDKAHCQCILHRLTQRGSQDRWIQARRIALGSSTRFTAPRTLLQQFRVQASHGDSRMEDLLRGQNESALC